VRLPGTASSALKRGPGQMRSVSGRTVSSVTTNGSPYATGPLSRLPCLSVTLVYCGQTVGWIKMPLGTEVGLGPGDIVLDGDPAAPTVLLT